MESEELQIDYVWARNLEQTYGRFNFADSRLKLDESGLVCAAIEFALEVSQSPMQLLDAMDV
jgi:hypothetical protein